MGNTLEFPRTSVFSKKRMTTIATNSNPLNNVNVDEELKKIKHSTLKARYKKGSNDTDYFGDTTESLNADDHMENTHSMII
jgi:hypothetical protein